jgi:predicted DNA-binding protein
LVALSVRLDPVLEARVEEETKRLGISKSDLVKDALELRLGLKNPYDLLRRVRSGGLCDSIKTSAPTRILRLE